VFGKEIQGALARQLGSHSIESATGFTVETMVGGIHMNLN
jgi:hypothetical protein